MAKQIHFDASADRAYVTFAFGGSHATVYLEVGYMVPVAALAAFAAGSPPTMCSLEPDIIGAPTAGNGQELFMYQNGGPGTTIDGLWDDWGSKLPHSFVGAVPFVLKTLSKHTGAGGYFGVDGSTSPDSATGTDENGLMVGMNTGGGSKPGFESWVTHIKAGTTDGGSELFSFDAATAVDLSAFTLVFGDVTLVDPTPPPATVGYRSPFWRFCILDLKTFETLSFLDRLASSRVATYTLNHPAVSEGVVPSENPEINIPWPTVDSDPFLTEGSRVLLGFRREHDTPPYWQIRFAGIIMQLEDTAQSDNAFSHYTAYDPWQYLFSRPACKADGSLPGANGLSYSGEAANLIALDLLSNTIANQGICGIDAGIAYGGTGDYTGTIETCDLIDINFPQGTTVGQAWQTLANLDVLDIILEPIYDPINRPGYLVQANIYTQAGMPRDDAIFAWDMPSRSLVGISRLIEGGVSRGNEVKFFAGQGGAVSGGQSIPVQTDAASVAKYGEYWQQQFLPGQIVVAAVTQLAAAQLALAKDGKVTVAISPAPERSPIPFTDYWLGDRVPVYASNRFRAPIPAAGSPSSDVNVNYQRVYGVPLIIADDATEQINQMLTAIPA